MPSRGAAGYGRRWHEQNEDISAKQDRARVPGSGSMCTGRSACRNAPIAISTAMSARSRSTKRALSRPIRAELAHRAALTPGRTVVLDLFRRRHAVLDEAVDRRRASLMRSRGIGRSPRRRRSRSKPIRPASRRSAFAAIGGRRQPRLARRAGAERRRSQSARPRPHGGGGAAAVDARGLDFRALSRFDLIYARPGQTRGAIGARSLTRASPAHATISRSTSSRSNLAPCSRACAMRESSLLPDHDLGRALWDVDAGDDEPARACPLMKSPTTRAPARRAGTISSIGAMANMPGSAPARMAAFCRPTAGARKPANRDPEMWLTVVESEGHALVEDEPLSVEEQGDEFLLMGLRLAEGIEPRRFEAYRGPRSRSPPARLADRRPHGRMHAARPRRVSAEGFPVLDAVVADLAA